MKKFTFLCFSLSICLMGTSQSQLNNNGFENWTNVKYAEYPSLWFNAYQNNGNPNPSTPMVEKSSDAAHLSSSVKLTTINDNSNPMFGFVLHGTVGDMGPTGGVPFTLAADSLIFDAKFNILPGDSANVLVDLKNGGTSFYQMIFRFGGVQSTWKRFSMPINPTNGIPDSLILGFTSSEIMNGGQQVGSWIMIDNVRFKDGTSESAPIPNPSFENWTPIEAYEADSWSSFNSIYTSTGFNPVQRSTDAQSGTYAMELKTDSTLIDGSNEIAYGYAVYGTILSASIKGRPFSASPTMLSGNYKYTMGAPGDSAVIDVYFYKNGSIAGLGNYSFKSPKTTYTSFSIPLTVFLNPDSVLVIVDAGETAGSSFKIDQLVFSGGNVGVDEIGLNEPSISVFPNPASDIAHLNISLTKSSEVSYELMNALGQKVLFKSLGYMNEGSHEINLKISSLPSGVYLLKTQVGNKSFVNRLIIK